MTTAGGPIDAGLALSAVLFLGWALRERMTSGDLRHRNAQLQTLVSNGRAKLADAETKRHVLEQRLEAIEEVLETTVAREVC